MERQLWSALTVSQSDIPDSLETCLPIYKFLCQGAAVFPPRRCPNRCVHCQAETPGNQVIICCGWRLKSMWLSSCLSLLLGGGCSHKSLPFIDIYKKEHWSLADREFDGLSWTGGKRDNNGGEFSEQCSTIGCLTHTQDAWSDLWQEQANA